MPDIQRFSVPVEPRLELGAIVGLKRKDPERESLANLVQEADRRALIAGVVDLQDSDPGTVIDCGELVEPLTVPGIRSRNFTSMCRRCPG